MAITVDPLTNGDFTRINRADATTGWTMGDGWSMIALDTTSPVENTGCMQARVPAGIGSAVANFTSRSLENVHMRMWAKLGQSISAGATYGARLIVGTAANHGSWIVYDADKQVVVYNGWMMLVVDPRKPYDATVGTAPSDILAVTDAGCRVDFVDGNGKDLVVADMLWEGNEVSIEGGTSGARGTFAEWGTADRSNGYGILRRVGGVYYLNAGAVFQGPGTADSYFEDTNRLIVFEDLPVSGSLYKWRHVGNSTGTNHFQLGSSSGSGTAKEGSAGGVIRAAGAAPFRIEAIDTNIDVAAYFGVTMLGPSALYADQLRNCKRDDGGTVTDQTTVANSVAANDLSPFPTPAVNDAVYFGHDERFYNLTINTGTAKSGTYTIVWEYYNGSSWASLTDLTDGTNGFTTTGAQTVTFAIPDDWAKQTTGSDNRYWVRARISAFTSSTTVPLVTQVTVGMAGDIRWEDPAAEIIGCTLAQMGSVRVRNGAFLKKTTITNSVVPAKHAAVDFGDTDPSADTVRDLVIQNCNKGILLKGTSTGTTTYNFRNIKFAGNTNDVRVDFPAGATVVINILEFGDSPSVDNVNGSTVNIVSARTAKATCKDSSTAAVIPNVEVLIRAAAGGDLPVDDSVTISVSSSVATVTHAAHGVPNGEQVQIRGVTGGPTGWADLNGIKTTTFISAGSYSYPTTASDGSASGTITSTGVVLFATTDGSGVAQRTDFPFTANQPVEGYARKSTSSPVYQTAPISGDVTSAAGFTTTVSMTSDE